MPAVELVPLTVARRPQLEDGEVLVRSIRADSAFLRGHATPLAEERTDVYVTLTNRRLLVSSEALSDAVGVRLANVADVRAEEETGRSLFRIGLLLRVTVEAQPPTRLHIRWRKRKPDAELFARQVRETTTRCHQLLRQEAESLEARDSRRRQVAPLVGVQAVRAAQTLQLRTRDEALERAFADTDALFCEASELVKMSQRLKEIALARRQAELGADTEAALLFQFRDLMQEFGILSPIQTDSVPSGRTDEFHEQLARECYEFLEPRLRAHGGALSLLDAFVMYNSSRATSTIVSAWDMLQACRKWEPLRLSASIDEIEGGYIIRGQQLDQPSEALIAEVERRGCISEFEAAELWNLPVPLARQQLVTAEACGRLCRDDDGTGMIRFFISQFDEFIHQCQAVA